MKRKDFLKAISLLPLTASAINLNDLKRITDTFENSPKMPAIFIGHGSPMNAIQVNAFTKKLNAVGANFVGDKKPKAILVVSAHWLTKGTFVCNAPQPKIIYDFGGFPDELFAVKYPAKGSPEFAKAVNAVNPKIQETHEWGLDHGAWTILKHIFPKADIPVFQLSIDYYQSMQYHFDLAKTLSSLREKGVLIIGSGNIVHNLGMSMKKFQEDDPKAFDWAIEFDAWVKQKLVGADFKSLLEYEKQGTAAKLSVPTVDHYVPMIYTVGLAKDKEPITQLYEQVEYGGVSMRCFQVGL